MATSLRYRLPPLTLLAASIASALWASTSAAQSSDPCSVSPAGNIDCNITGTYAKPVDVVLESEPDDALPPVFVRSNAVIDARAYPELVGGLLIQAKGKDGGDARPNGEDALGLTVENTGDIKLQAAENAAGNVPVFGLLAQLRGGDATSNGGNGGAAGGTGVSLVNSGSIDMSGLSSDRINGGAGVAGIALGGDGAGSSGSAVGNGAGGGASAVNLFNHGDVTASVRGDGLFSGVLAASRGGTGADFVDGRSSSGGDAGEANLLNQANIVVDRTWSDLGASENSALFGVLAESHGGNGGASSGRNEAGAGGAAISASVDVRPGASVHVTQRIADSDASANAIRHHGAGVAVLLTGGDGGNIAGDGDGYRAGDGGDAGSIDAMGAVLDIADANVVTSGNGLPALLVRVRGGTGGAGLPQAEPSSRPLNHGGHGGNAGQASISVFAKRTDLRLSTDGNDASAIEVLQQGGAGGDGAGYLDRGEFEAGDGGTGGRVGNLWLDLSASSAEPLIITTTGSNSHGIYARQLGGEGGDGGTMDGGTVEPGSRMSTGGPGGMTDAMTIMLKNAAISTSGSRAFGIWAQNRAGNGGRGAVDNITGRTLGEGGEGGRTGDLKVSLDAASSLFTEGAGAFGIFAQTAGGAGGNPVGDSVSNEVQDGAGGRSGGIEVHNEGIIVTQGAEAIGILAQSIAGSAGAEVTDDGMFDNTPQSGSSAGQPGGIYVSHSGAVTTRGEMAPGIVAQSVGGGGGVAIGRGVAALGGSAATTALLSDARESYVQAHSLGSVMTHGRASIGILTQSVGGGGGLAAAEGRIGTLGSSGGKGGQPGRGDAYLENFRVVTLGSNAHGVVAQSVGGGGGVLSNANAKSWFASLKLGQAGGDGGAGGSAVVDLYRSNIVTQGSKAVGVVAQSIGGGGGVGGQAFAEIDPNGGAILHGSVVLGASGGLGGNGGQVSSEMVAGSLISGYATEIFGDCGAALCPTAGELPIDAFGVVLQSIGGGGGLAGNVSADALAADSHFSDRGQATLATHVALGAASGVSGDGHYVTFAINQGGQIATAGQGSHALLVQSIGAGGGSAGDSSSMAATAGPSSAETAWTLEPRFTLGASGDAGGRGGPVGAAIGGLIHVAGTDVRVTPDPVGSPVSIISTYGDYANGLTVQSIGGGGGNAGFGSARTQASSLGATLAPTIKLGGAGAGGGRGGEVTVGVLPTGVVQTWGSGAIGVLAQSIGGGGGSAQGGSLTLSGAQTSRPGGMTLTLGREGGANASGAAVEAIISGVIATHGGDAAALQAQSIGGGGGQGGSAGSDASFDNPIIVADLARAHTSNVARQVADMLRDLPPESPARSFQNTLTLGEAGGSNNRGGAVDIKLNAGATLFTEGDWSNGIMAQSVGGGGGKAGSALATGTGWIDPAKYSVSTRMTLGAQDSEGAHAGDVTTSLSGASITTSGFGASGIMAQSVGGGGGHAVDGSDAFLGSITLGMRADGRADAGGHGGIVNVVANSSPSTITTHGEAAFGIALQSVGGGGGFAGAGSHVVADASGFNLPPVEFSVSSARGQSGSQGGAVTLSDNAGLNIATAGNNAFGIVAQSVGGGGGMIVNSQRQLAVTGATVQLSGAVDALGRSTETNGGDVTIDLSSSSSIVTTGTGAHGVIAQSVGGGGGVLGLPGTATKLTIDPQGVHNVSPGMGNGGDVTVTANGRIAVSGAGAVGVLAQSVSGAGGLLLSNDGQTVFAGSASPALTGAGSVSVTVAKGASVSAAGENGIGIFAQNAGSQQGVALNIDGAVNGGASGSNAAAIWVDSAAPSTMAIGESGSVYGNGATAIRTTSGTLDVSNQGRVFGSVGLNGGTMINDGLYVPGATFNGQLLNRGRVLLGGVEADVPGMARSQYTATTHTGSLTQTSDGMLQLGADFNTQQFDAIHASGDVHLDGELTVLSRALLPRRELAIVTSDSGTPTGTLTPLDTLIFDYATRNAGNATRLFVAGADFNADDMQLRGNQKHVAEHLQEGWDAGGSPALATFYATLDTIARAGAATYQQRMSDLSPGVTLAPGAQSQLAMGRFTRAMMSCPTWTDTITPYKEQSCVWADVSRRSTDQDGYSTVSGYSYDTVTYQFGGQREIAPHWFLGGSVAYQTAQVRGDDSRVKGDGDAGYAGLVLKREDGPWTYSAALSAGYGSFDMDRSLSIPNYEERARSHPDVVTVGTRLRAARTFTNGKLYVKPFVDLTGQYARVPGYQESGDALSLDVQSSEQFVLGLEPAFEVGARMELPKGIVLRPFAYAGLLLSSVDGWTTQASLDGAPNGTGTFQTTMPMDSVVRRVGLGLQMLSGKGASMRVQYDGEFSSSAKSHAGSLKLAVPF